MSQKSEHRISQRRAKANFSSIGFFLIAYSLISMFIPYALNTYFLETNSDILRDSFKYNGLHYLFIVVGSILPFFMMRLFSKVKIKKIFRPTEASFVDLFVQTIVFFTICLLSTYASNTLFSYFNLEGKLISGIALSYDSDKLKDLFYVLFLIVISPILEEYAFRGVLLSSLSRYGKVFGLYASSLFFALAHNNFAEMIPAFVMAVMLGKTALRYKSIRPTIVIHILFNGFIYLLCIIPSEISKYMTLGLVAICGLACYLFLSGRYERIQILKSKSNRITNLLFYSRVSVIVAMLLLVAYTYIYNFM